MLGKKKRKQTVPRRFKIAIMRSRFVQNKIKIRALKKTRIGECVWERKLYSELIQGRKENRTTIIAVFFINLKETGTLLKHLSEVPGRIWEKTAKDYIIILQEHVNFHT